MALRVLVIAPRTNLLLVESEMASVVNHLRASLINGDISADDLLTKLEDQWDALWFMTHSDETGIHLTNEVLPSSILTSFIKTAGSSLVIFNTCSSYQVANEIYNELLIDFVCTIRPIPDRDAFFMGKQFAFHLSRGKSPHEAYLDAKLGGNKDYIFLSKRERPVLPHVPSHVASITDQGEMIKTSEEVRRLIELVDGNTRNQEPGLLKRVKDLSETVNKFEVDLRFMRLGLWIIAGTSALIMLILMGILLSAGN